VYLNTTLRKFKLDPAQYGQAFKEIIGSELSSAFYQKNELGVPAWQVVATSPHILSPRSSTSMHSNHSEATLGEVPCMGRERELTKEHFAVPALPASASQRVNVQSVEQLSVPTANTNAGGVQNSSPSLDGLTGVRVESICGSVASANALPVPVPAASSPMSVTPDHRTAIQGIKNLLSMMEFPSEPSQPSVLQTGVLPVGPISIGGMGASGSRADGNSQVDVSLHRSALEQEWHKNSMYEALKREYATAKHKHYVEAIRTLDQFEGPQLGLDSHEPKSKRASVLASFLDAFVSKLARLRLHYVLWAMPVLCVPYQDSKHGVPALIPCTTPGLPEQAAELVRMLASGEHSHSLLHALDDCLKKHLCMDSALVRQHTCGSMMNASPVDRIFHKLRLIHKIYVSEFLSMITRTRGELEIVRSEMQGARFGSEAQCQKLLPWMQRMIAHYTTLNLYSAAHAEQAAVSIQSAMHDGLRATHHHSVVERIPNLCLLPFNLWIGAVQELCTSTWGVSASSSVAASATARRDTDRVPKSGASAGPVPSAANKQQQNKQHKPARRGTYHRGKASAEKKAGEGQSVKFRDKSASAYRPSSRPTSPSARTSPVPRNNRNFSPGAGAASSNSQGQTRSQSQSSQGNREQQQQRAQNNGERSTQLRGRGRGGASGAVRRPAGASVPASVPADEGVTVSFSAASNAWFDASGRQLTQDASIPFIQRHVAPSFAFPVQTRGSLKARAGNLAGTGRKHQLEEGELLEEAQAGGAARSAVDVHRQDAQHLACIQSSALLDASACSEQTSRAHSVEDFAGMLSSAQAQTLTQALLAAHPTINSAGSCRRQTALDSSPSNALVSQSTDDRVEKHDLRDGEAVALYAFDDPRLVEAYESVYDLPHFHRDGSGRLLTPQGHDSRAEAVLFMPGANEDWPLNTLSRVSCPTMVKVQDVARQLELASSLQSPEADRLLARMYQKYRIKLFLADSGAHMTQIHESMADILRPNSIRPMDTPIQLLTASSNEGPVCMYQGVLDFILPGYPHILSVDCLLRPGDSKLMLFSERDFHNIVTTSGSKPRLQFWNDSIVIDDFVGSLVRIHEMPFIPLVIPREGDESVRPYMLSQAMSAIARRPASETADYVHRLLGHPHLQACERTVEKAVDGLPKLPRGAFKSLDASLCSTCGLGIRKASTGQGFLSHGLPHPTRRGQIIVLDNIGPFAVPGLFQEKYICHIHDIFSKRKDARAVKAKSDVTVTYREMLTDCVAILLGTKEQGEEITIILHCDNDVCFKSAEWNTMVRSLGVPVRMHYGAPYDARTCPHIERSGGVIVSGLRARLLEGMFPPKFWSVLLRVVVWSLNRIVGIDGYAPVELFDRIPLSFKALRTIPGVMVYWHVDARNRVIPKLSLTAGTGVYLGPAEAWGQSGQMVYTSDGRVIATPYVVPDETIRPYQQGLRYALARQTTHALDHLPDGLQPGTFMLPGGIDAMSLIGAGVCKVFYVDNAKTQKRAFQGRVVQVRQDPVHQEHILFSVVYEDGDEADYTYDELHQILTGVHVTAASFASDDPVYHTPEVLSGYAFPVALASVEPELDHSMVAYLASCVRQSSSTATCLLRHASEPSEVTKDLQFMLCMPAKSRASTTPADRARGAEYTWTVARKMAEPDYSVHVKAMTAEMDKLVAEGGERHHGLPKDVNPRDVLDPVGVFKLKPHSLHSQGPELKARYCANGRTARRGDTYETTANAASHSRLRLVIALSVGRQWYLVQIDVKSAFTKVKLPDGRCIWLRPLPGFPDLSGKGLFIKLFNHLYGHPEANHAWTEHWIGLVIGFGFKAADRLRTMFFFERGHSKMRMATVVDDSVLAHNSKLLWKEFRSYLEVHLPIAVEELSVLCGLQIHRNLRAESIFVSQSEYIANKARKHGWDTEGRAFSTPMAADWAPGLYPEQVSAADVKDARMQVGSLLWATITHPEIQYSCSRYAAHVTAPTDKVKKSILRTGKYLNMVRESGLTFRNRSWTLPSGQVVQPNEAIIFVDASLGRSEGQHSQTGIFVLVNGSVVYSKSGRQTQVADSSGKSETIALHEACHVAVQFIEELTNLGCPPKGPMLIMCDSNAAVIFAKKGWGKNSLHYDLKLLYIHECQKKGLIRVEYVPTEFQLADILTKPCPHYTASRLLPHILGDEQRFSGAFQHDEVKPRAETSRPKSVLRKPAAVSLSFGLPASGSRQASPAESIVMRSTPAFPSLTSLAAPEQDSDDDVPDLVESTDSDDDNDVPPVTAPSPEPVTLDDVAPPSRPVRFVLVEDVGITLLSRQYNGVSMDAYLLDRHETAVDVIHWRGQDLRVVAAGTLVMSFGSHYHAHGIRAMLVDTPFSVAVLCQEDVCLSRLPSGQYPRFEIVEFEHQNEQFTFLQGLRLEHVCAPLGRELYRIGDHESQEICIAPMLMSLRQAPPRLWYSSPSGVPFGPRRRYQLTEHVRVVLDEQFLQDDPEDMSGMSYIPTDFLPWLHEVCTVQSEDHHLVFSLLGRLRFRLYPSMEVLELPCRLAPNLCFQLDLASLLRGRHRNLTSDNGFSFESETLRLGDTTIESERNAQNLLLARAMIIPPMHDSQTVNSNWGPREQDPSRWLFHIRDTVSLALIPSSYAMFLTNVEPPTPYEPPILGHPVVSKGTLNLCLNSYESPPSVHSFPCAVLARDFADFVLSQHAIEALELPGSSSPSIQGNFLHFCGQRLPLRWPFPSLDVRVVPPVLVPYLAGSTSSES
jgi:hypothetical protein